MRSHLWIVAVAVAACAKDKPKDDGLAGAATGEAAVRGFIEAALAGDVDRARRFLPDDAACAAAPPAHVTPCTENGRQMRDRVPEIVADLPRGAKLRSVVKSKDATPAPELGLWTVTLDDESEDFMTVQIGNRYFAAFAIARKREN
jgi:hypothetical protein